MKVIKDTYMAWLDSEIESIELVDTRERSTYDQFRLQFLTEAKTKLTEVITEEFHKLSESKDA